MKERPGSIKSSLGDREPVKKQFAAYNGKPPMYSSAANGPPASSSYNSRVMEPLAQKKNMGLTENEYGGAGK